MIQQDDKSSGRSALAIGLEWSTRVITFSLEVALLAYAGHWLDEKSGTSPTFLIVGFGLGMMAFFVNLMAITKHTNRTEQQERKSNDD